MGSGKIIKKLHKNLMQVVSCFPISLFFIAPVIIFLIFTFRYHHPTRIILLEPMTLPLIANISPSSIFCTVGPIEPRATPSTSSPATTVSAEEHRGRTKKGNGEGGGPRRKKNYIDCDIFDGRWVEDEMSYPMYEAGSCPFVEEAFDCFKNGRPDLNYTKLRWQPKSCFLPRLDGRKLLKILRGKRLAFVGDSLNRNMWESLVCILRNSLENKDGVLEITGKKEFKHQDSYAFKFTEYNCTIEFYRAPFLVQEWEVLSSNGAQKKTLRLDMMDKTTLIYKTANVIIFNSAHWWTHVKTSKGEDFYQEGDHVHRRLSADDAYRRALTTWAQWVDENIDPEHTKVFFRGYSWSHFSGGLWNSGGGCNGETLPIINDRHLSKYPNLLNILEAVVSRMRTPVAYLNITIMTDYRKEAHPSMYRFPKEKRRPGENQDCSHWCLPGVPDAWNELMYAMLMKRLTR